MDIGLSNGFIINPTIEVTPVIRISPFTETDWGKESTNISVAKDYLSARFGRYGITVKAREAIVVALSYYNLHKEDIVTIVTTSGNRYVSGCVTRAIEKVCSWSMEITRHTKVILVIHEFGYPCTRLNELQQYGIPIIEDCALSFASVDPDKTIGGIGDFVIYSLPKFFPMQIGGILVSNKRNLTNAPFSLSKEMEEYILRKLSFFIPSMDKMLRQRMSNYHYLKETLKELDIRPFFPLDEGVYPAVFLFSWYEDMDYPHLKEYMQRNGIESSVFYGKNAFFIPVHHQLRQSHLDYMSTLLKYYRNGLR